MEILVIRFSGMGDIVMLLQTLQKLKQKYDNARITLLCDSSNRDIAKNSGGLIDNVLTINRRVFKEKKFFAIVSEIYNLFGLRKKKYDLIIDFQNFGETALITYLCQGKEKRGASKKKNKEYAYTTIVPRDESGHRSQFFSRIAGVDDSLDFSKMVLSQTASAYRNTVLAKLDGGKKTIGLNIGSTQESRRWSEKNFAQLAEHFKKDFNILVFAGKNEKKYLGAFSNDVIRVCDVTVDELCGAIGASDYFISNDTGPVHVAAALSIPTLTFFSTGTDENVGALSAKKIFLSKKNINEIMLKDAIEKISLILS
ncbi:MAG: glycosyltransferase family 9 protein [Campylobacteraceae bacterium]|nr:glycosyltransferase family 9 protein [Campylobacteraceae bacterium]